MNAVEPIRDPEQVRLLEERLGEAEGQRGQRMYLQLMLGIYLGLRISDLLKLKVSDLRGRDVLLVRETKTGKMNQLPLSDKIKRVLRQRLRDLPGDEYVLKSRQKDPDGKPKAISWKTAYNDIQAMGKMARMDIPLGCHSLRKTFGYHYYKQSGDIAFLMIWFNHSSAEVTKRYIGIDLDELVKKIKRFEI